VYGVDINPSPQDLLLYNNFKFEQLDLRELGAPEKVVNGALNVFGGRVDILLNIAGVMDTNNSVDNLEEDTWDRIVAINLTVPTMLSKHVVKAFRNQGGGNIVNVSSKAGISGAVAGMAYTATKHALVSTISCLECDICRDLD
jgi:NAD(P)-dependent dehydrogenase (short-subunit alcohol dehydrogenase family)